MAGAFGYLGQAAVRFGAYPYQSDVPLVHLRGFVHQVEDSLCAGQGAQQEVALLGQLVQRHGALTHKHQVGAQAAQIAVAGQHEQAAHAGCHRVVHIGKAYHRGHHHARIAGGGGARFAQGFVQQAEPLKILRLMVEHLFHLLTGHHLLHKAVQFAKVLLLLGEIVFAALAAVENKGGHGRQKRNHDQGKPGVQHDQQGDGAGDHAETLDQQGKTVVQGFGHGIHVVGEMAHQFPMGMAVKILQGQALDMGEQILPDFGHHLLGGAHHQLVVAKGGQRTHGIHHRHAQNGPGKPGQVTRGNKVVDDRFEQIGAHQIGQAADNDQHGHRGQRQPVHPQIAAQAAQRLFQVFWPLIAGRYTHCHYNPAPSCCE